MREFSSGRHHVHISAAHADDVLIDDPVLPAAAHLTSAAAADALGAAVESSGAELVASRPRHVQYRPGFDLIVRYDATIRRDGREHHDTLIAATTSAGPPPGTVPVEATTDAGDHLIVGVWRWPFDPVLTALERAVTPGRAEGLLGDVVSGPVALEVVAYRPTERAVVRTTDAMGRVRYVKLTAPDTTAALVDRHVRLGAAGVPVPEVLAADLELGWLAMTELAGPTLRERLKAGAPPWPRPEGFADVIDRIRSVELTDAAPRRPRCLDAGGHARMLASVMPAERHRLDELIGRFEPLAEQALARRGPTVHGDLHEGQLVVDDDTIIGVLDIDDVGPGDPVDDMATVIGHLRYRAGTAVDGTGPAIDGYADALWRGFADRTDPVELDTVTAAVLVGLATGPFRIQQHDWATVVRGRLDVAERLLDTAGVVPIGAGGRGGTPERR